MVDATAPCGMLPPLELRFAPLSDNVVKTCRSPTFLVRIKRKPKIFSYKRPTHLILLHTTIPYGKLRVPSAPLNINPRGLD